MGKKSTPPPPTVRTSAVFRHMPLSVPTTTPLTHRSRACPSLFGASLPPCRPLLPADAVFVVAGAAYAALASPICAAPVGGTRVLYGREETFLWSGGGACDKGGDEPPCLFDDLLGLRP